MEAKIKDKLSPHFGHLKFLMGIHREGISFDDMSNLIDLIKDDHLLNNLPKPLHSYDSYINLVLELYYIKKNIVFINLFKKLTKETSDIFNLLLKDTKFSLVESKLLEIISDNGMLESFKRWSSRVKDVDYAITYILSVKNKDSLDNIFSDVGLVRLSNYKDSIGIIPNSWCITKEDVFNDYNSRRCKMYMGYIYGNLYGINEYSNGAIGIYDERNNSIYAPYIVAEANQLVQKTKLVGESNTDLIIRTKVIDDDNVSKKIRRKTKLEVYFNNLLKRIKDR